jgi:S1-C subfamily serine protease
MSSRRSGFLAVAILVVVTLVAVSPAAAQPGGIPSMPSSDTVPPAARRGYTGMRTGGTLTARIVGTTVVKNGEPDVVIVRVDKDSPAERAGLAAGDVILEVDDVSVNDEALRFVFSPGVSYVLRVRRGQQEIEVTLVPGPPQPITTSRPNR